MRQGRGVVWAAMMLAGVGWAGCQSKGEQGAGRRATVRMGDLVFEAEYYGDLEAAKSVPIHVPDLPETDQVTVDTVRHDGDVVKKGDVVLSFVKDTMQMDLRDALEALEVAKAERQKVAQQLAEEKITLKLDLQRKRLALERAKLQVVEGVNLISKLELDKAKLDVKQAELEEDLADKALGAFQKKQSTTLGIEDLKVEAAQRTVDNKGKGLELVELQAPVDGVIYAPYTRLNWQRTKVAPGVVARPGDKVLEIPDLTAYKVAVYIRQRDAVLVQVGDEAEVRPLILPDTTIKAKVTAKEAFATTRNERLGTKTEVGNLKEYLVTLELEEAPEQLRPGNSARVKIRSVLAKDATLLPLMFVRQDRTKNRWVVQLESGETKAVSVGRTTWHDAEVTGGLEPGDVVVLPEGEEP